jgi:hypothetical protein
VDNSPVRTQGRFRLPVQCLDLSISLGGPGLEFHSQTMLEHGSRCYDNVSDTLVLHDGNLTQALRCKESHIYFIWLERSRPLLDKTYFRHHSKYRESIKTSEKT